MKKLLVIMFVLGVCFPVYSQVSLGVSPLLMERSVYYPTFDTSFTNKHTGVEFNLSALSRGVALRGYHLLNTTNTNPYNLLEDASTKKFKLVELNDCFCATRIEIGLPFFYSDSVLEPFYVNSYTKRCTSIINGPITTSDTILNNTSGLGLYYGQKFMNTNGMSLKFSVTPKDKIFDATYNTSFRTGALGIGYTYREYENVKVKGPLLLLQLVF